jgi:DNA-binding NarL/FixJ family response regulator
MKRKIKIMLVEDNTAYRRGINCALESNPDLELISEFGTAEIALRSLQNMSTRHVPDLILLDLNLPGMSGLDALPYFRKSIPEARIIILTQSDREADVLLSIELGAAGYLLKSSSMEELMQGIQNVSNGGATLDPGLATFIIRTLRKRQHEKESRVELSQRALEVLALIAEGHSQKQIADQLGISVYTVGEHIHNIYEKLDVPNAPAAVNRAHRLGLFSSGD